MVELMVAMVLLSLLMGAAYSSIIAQMRSHATQTLVSETMLAARSALGVLADQVERAGFGVPTVTEPSVAPSLISAEPNRVSFWTNVTATHTYLTAPAVKNGLSISVLSADGMAVGGNVYISDTDHWYRGKITQMSDRALQVNPPLPRDFAAGSLLTPVEQVTFELVGGELWRNGQMFIPNISQLRFTYDSDDLSAIRIISIALGVQTRAEDVSSGKKLEVLLSTEVAPPNLAL